MKKKLLSFSFILLLIFISPLLLSCSSNTENLISRFYSYDNFEEYLLGANNIDSKSIKHIDVDWISGNIKVESSIGSSINFYEIVDADVEDIYKLHYRIINNTLYIKFVASQESFKYSFKTKDLYIQIPEQMILESLTINSVEANVYMNNVNINTVNHQSIDGNFECSKSSLRDISLKTTGIVYFVDLTNDSLKINGTNPKVTLDVINSNSVFIRDNSGDIRITRSNINSLSITSLSSPIDVELFTKVSSTFIETFDSEITIKFPINTPLTLEYDSIDGILLPAFAFIQENGVYNSNTSNVPAEEISNVIIKSLSGKLRLDYLPE